MIFKSYTKADLLAKIVERDRDIFVEGGRAYCKKCGYSRMYNYKSKDNDMWLPCICQCQFLEREKEAKEKALKNGYEYEPKQYTDGTRLTTTAAKCPF